MSVAVPVLDGEGRPWKRAALWLAFLAPFFYLSYGTANWLASIRPDVGSVVFGWEPAVPFLAWTIIPYWTINAFYGLSLFLCRTKAELDTHGRRLLTAQVIAVACFLAVPLRFTFDKPVVDGGFSGFLFEALAGFDKPFNQAPSLHIALLVILWTFYARHLPRAAHPLLHAWAFLIGVSVLTTRQHHFIDIPTGALLGLLCLWAWPDAGPSPLSNLKLTQEPKRIKLAIRYLGGGLVLAAFAGLIGGAGLWLLYPAVSLWMVAAAYVAVGPSAFGKRPDGTMPLAARLLFGPYVLAAWINSRLWTRRAPAPVEVTDGVFLGRMPSRRDLSRGGYAALVDLAAELPAPRAGIPVAAFPMLDLVAPPVGALRSAAEAVERARSAGGPVLVVCALGYSRSAATVAAWLLRTGRVTDPANAVALVRKARPAIVLTADALRAVAEAGRRR